MTLRHSKKPPRSSIIIFAGITTVAIWSWPRTDPRVEHWTEQAWFDYGVGVVRRIGSSDFWDEYSNVSGQGTLCLLRAGSWIKGTTGGSYYSMMIQLPPRVEVGDEFEIVPFHTPESNAQKEIREMSPGTVVAMRFGNPNAWYLSGASADSIGRITVLGLDHKYVTILARFDLTLEENVRLRIDEELRIERRIPDSPLHVGAKTAR